MQRTKSIFFKYFFICSAVILISFVCLGAVLLLVSSRYFVGEKRDRLLSNLEKASDEVVQLAAESFSETASGGTDGDDWELDMDLWEREVSQKLRYYSTTDNAALLVFDSSGRLLTSAGDVNTQGFDEKLDTLPQKALSLSETTPTYLESDLEGYFSAVRHNAMEKVTVKGVGTVCVVLTAPISAQDESVVSMLRLYLVSAVAVLVLTVVIIYFTTKRLTAPIKEIAEAARKIGNGDFTTKLPEYDITEFNELGEAINDMSLSISSYDKSRGSFVANVSHELRTPMTTIGGFVDGIIDGTIPPPQQKRYLMMVSDEIKRLTRMVKAMLNLAKIESGSTRLVMKPVNILEIAATTLFSFEKRINEKELEIRGLDTDRVMVMADEDLLHQVVYNLLENAIKFVNKGGYIAFEFSENDGVTEISVANSGEGLKEEELALVFNRFYKTDESRGKDSTGVGLGLNIVKSIIRLHDGSIRVTSVEGEYTKFIISLKTANVEKNTQGGEQR